MSVMSPAVEAGPVRMKEGARAGPEPADVAAWTDGDFFEDDDALVFCGAFAGAFPDGFARAPGAGALAGAEAAGAAGAGAADGVGPTRPGRSGVGKGMSCASTGGAASVTKSAAVAAVAASRHVRTLAMLPLLLYPAP
jgi:hypothetical protein